MAESLKNHKKIKYWKCPDCANKYTSYNLLVRHVETVHKEVIPDGQSVHQYLFNRRNNKTGGKCVICGKPTTFNETTRKYNRFCSENCRKKAGEIAERNLKKKTGKTRKERMSDPKTQIEMLKNRTISGTYVFRDGKTTIGYVGSYELDFLKFYDLELKLDPLDIIECPYFFEYIYENEKHTYIPDFAIMIGNSGGPNIIATIIEIKDGAESNQTNKAIIETSQVKEKYKDQAVIASKKFNFIKIRDKKYDDFVNLLEILKERNSDGGTFEPIIINPDR